MESSWSFINGADLEVFKGVLACSLKLLDPIWGEG